MVLCHRYPATRLPADIMLSGGLSRLNRDRRQGATLNRRWRSLPTQRCALDWQSHGESNPGFDIENVTSWPLDDGTMRRDTRSGCRGVAWITTQPPLSMFGCAENAQGTCVRDALSPATG